MPLPPDIDFDKLVRIAQDDLVAAVSKWLDGYPREEPALMNQVTGTLGKHRGCDVGVRNPVKMTRELALLHRKGTDQKDLFGSDLAITLRINDTEWIKTSLFQFKTSTDFHVELKRSQLEDALSNPLTQSRSYIFVVDQNRTGMRIIGAEAAFKEFKPDHKVSQTYDVAQCLGVVKWLEEWLSAPADELIETTKTTVIEQLLRSYVLPSPWDDGLFATTENVGGDSILPARAWLRFSAQPWNR